MKFAFSVIKYKPLFKNYYVSALRYALFRFGLVDNNRTVIKCFNGLSTQTTLHAIGAIIHAYIVGGIKDIDCLSGTVITFDGSLSPISEFEFSDHIGDALKNGWRYDVNNGFWLNYGIKFKHMHGPNVEVFDLNEYGFIDVRGRVVTDIGAFVGDSAIYFILRGAKKVYAIEPHPGAYQEMLENIRLNNMESKVVPINAALGSKSGEIRILSTNSNINTCTTAATYYKSRGSDDIEVPMITLG